MDWLKDRTILLIVGGSRCYGLATESSDVDIKGVCVAPKPYYFGLQRFEQADAPVHMNSFVPNLTEEEQEAVKKTKIEGAVYELTKFVKLAIDCNPNILDLLYCRDSEVRQISKAGEVLRENRDLFLSKKAKHTFSGYAHSQLNRIKGHREWLLNPPKTEPLREHFGLPAIPSDFAGYNRIMQGIQHQIDQWQIDFGVMSESEKLRIKENITSSLTDMGFVASENWRYAAQKLGTNDELIAHIEKEKSFADARRHWCQYQEWKRNRNPERAVMEAQFGYDLKHSCHLVRLYRMGKEILLTGKVNVWREDREELLSIRRGAWSFDQVMEYVEQKDEELNTLYQSSLLKHKPDREKIENLTIEIMESYLK